MIALVKKRKHQNLTNLENQMQTIYKKYILPNATKLSSSMKMVKPLPSNIYTIFRCRKRKLNGILNRYNLVEGRRNI